MLLSLMFRTDRKLEAVSWPQQAAREASHCMPHASRLSVWDVGPCKHCAAPNPYILTSLKFTLQGTLHARRRAAAVVRGKDVLQKLFQQMADRYKDREGGYTRILRTRQRNNDAAHMAYIE